MIVPAMFVGALFVVLLWRMPPEEAKSSELLLAGPTMGTRYTIKIAAETSSTEAQRAALEAAVERALEAVDGSMSTWREDSELARFNRHGTEPFAASDELLEVVEKAIEISQATGGAFDVTVGPLVDAWGFGSEVVIGAPPDEQIERLLESTGTDRLALDTAGGTLAKDRQDLRVDLSALAKGYAVDQVAAVLSEAGFSSFMVEIGGEVVTRGRKADGESWRIGVEVPDPERRAVQTAVALDGAALATSGDYRNFRLEDGRRISHIIDPRTGRPVTHQLTSVSVIAPSCMIADAWATALTVLGPAEGTALARQQGLAALFIFRRDDGTLAEETTGGFETYVVAEEREATD
jgi:thiamine biosynthesis lipoprotein